ncbi:asparagine synthase [Verrucomicrobiia bacterium DG1235]|nr:asparagine synthase [Verrucomicrobiae bacterium DG1235]
MCGIAGIFCPERKTSTIGALIKKSISVLQHRGPDTTSSWIREPRGIALAHSRLAIIDLSSAGSQPMSSPNERYTVTYNGEIYNYIKIRTELKEKGYIFEGTSDTEVLCYSLQEWGIAKTITKLEGMFAIGIYDNIEDEVTLTRDPQGEKPLYYSISNNILYFASELKALTPILTTSISTTSVLEFLDYGYIKAPNTIYSEIDQLTPGQLIKFNRQRTNKSVTKHATNRRNQSHENPTDELDDLINESVKLRLQADVSVGCFLSGGIDSSLTAAIASKHIPNGLKTFSIGFEDPKFDETIYAEEVASKLGTDHTSHILSAQECLSMIPALPGIYDEPFADPSQIPTILVCKLARKSVKVAISGDAGDELFGGYNRHVTAQKWQNAQHIPNPLKKSLAAICSAKPTNGSQKVLKSLIRLLSTNVKPENASAVLAKIGTYLKCDSHDKLYYTIMGRLQTQRIPDTTPHTDALSAFLIKDLNDYLPNNILTKVDRAAMSVSLETRIPLLSSDIISFAHSLSNKYKIRGRETKWILKQVLYRYLPKELFDRPKTGFNIPLSEWLRGPLKEWATFLIEEPIDFQLPAGLNIQSEWEGFLNGDDNSYQLIWNYICLCSWNQTRKQELLQNSCR